MIKSKYYLSHSNTQKASNVLFLFVTFCFLLLVGCKAKAPDSSNEITEEFTTSSSSSFPIFSTEIRSLSERQLQELGACNTIPTEFVFPNSYYVQVVYPDRLETIENGDSAISYIENNTFQLPVSGLLGKAEIAIFSRGFSFETLKDAKSGTTIQDGFPSAVEIIYLKMKEKIDPKTVHDSIFFGVDSKKLKNVDFGKYSVTVFENSIVTPLDQSGQNLGKIDNMYAGLCFPSDDSVVFLSGSQAALELYFSEKLGDERGIAAQRLGRMSSDKAAMLFQYDCDFDIPNAQLVQFPFPLTPDLSEVIQKTVSAFQFTFDPTTPDGNLLTLNINVKTELGANDLRKAIGTSLLQIIDSINTQSKSNESDASLFISGIVDILKSVQITSDGNRVVATISNTPEKLKFVTDSIQQIEDFRKNSEIRARYQVAEQALMQFGGLFTRYSRENKVFPSPILATDGTPLLSWRVAILPILGDQYKELYNQFNLDEPWNSENNLKLLEKMPPIFAATSENAATNKTQFLIFNSAGTPFGSHPDGLKIQDVEDPFGALSVVFASPSNAIEWTKPESFVFNPSKPSDSFGNYVCAVTLMNELISAPCDDSPKTAQSLSALVFGISESIADAKTAPVDPSTDTTTAESEPNTTQKDQLESTTPSDEE